MRRERERTGRADFVDKKFKGRTCTSLNFSCVSVLWLVIRGFVPNLAP